MPIGPDPTIYDDADKAWSTGEAAEILVCVYCGKPLPDERTPCCGEVGHVERISYADQ